MSKTNKEIQDQLDAKIPREMVEQRASWAGGPKLSYLPGWYVIDRLNQVFGQANWSYEVVALDMRYQGSNKDGSFYTSYTAQVKLRTTFPDGPTRIDIDVGFGDCTDKNNQGKTHELATKEAVTDALKRCAKSLGMSMGLALYDKSQDFVEDEAPTTTKAKEAINDPAPNKTRGSTARKSPATGTDAPQVAPKAANTATQAPTNSIPAGDVVGSNPQSQNIASSGAVIGADLTKLTQQITAAARVLDKRGTVKILDFAAELKDKYKVTAVTQLATGQAIEIYNNLKTQHPFLGLQ